ncbi:hypothetical protein BT96DRAFT_1006348 [Gymnopus androsaceus JB14]|uniref:Uncharacterized protein n=1 Tax=Gymnopus androsaceus JB14 TaxID=1447944 RepID=A0A6A4GLJ9_9AGAR|nr:hypothetical protein BT96DRAFT_1006348 [Gymnopus androsaceus JB14]
MPAHRYEPYKNADRRRRAEADAANQAARYVVALAAVQEVPVPNDALKHFIVGIIIVLTVLRAVNTTWLQHLISSLSN